MAGKYYGGIGKYLWMFCRSLSGSEYSEGSWSKFDEHDTFSQGFQFVQVQDIQF